jgi:hypothetical protein
MTDKMTGVYTMLPIVKHVIKRPAIAAKYYTIKTKKINGYQKMNEQIKKTAQEAGFVFWEDEDWNREEIIDWASNYDQEIVKYTELILRKSLVDFYHRYLDTASNEDITVQVEQYINEQLGK